MKKKYTAEHIEYIAANIVGRSYQDLTDMFNERFGMEVKVKAMISLAFKHGLHNERDTRFNKGWEPTQFKKGHVPFNKGRRGVDGWKPTQFKKGHKPWNYKPVGTERTNTDGYVELKIADPNKWKGKHILLWEEANGPIPRGHVVIFADRNQQNVTLDNLLLVSRRELAVMNKRGLIANSMELTKTGIAVADIYLKIGERKNKI